MKFRKKPIEISAWKASFLIEAARHEWSKLPKEIIAEYDKGNILFLAEQIHITTPRGLQKAERDDWIICGTENEIYPCSQTIFAQIYDLAEPTI